MAAQLPDVLILNGSKMSLYSNPLEPYWDLHPKKRPVFETTKNCKRGYIATWEICNDLLILREIEGNVDKRSFIFWQKSIRFSWKMLFPKVKSGGIVAWWFTGKIRIPEGNALYYVHNAYDSRFERELIITLDKGKVIKKVVLDYKEQKLQVQS